MPVLELCRPPENQSLQWPGYALVRVSTAGTEVIVICMKAVLDGVNVTSQVNGVQLHSACLDAKEPFRIYEDELTYVLLAPCRWQD